MHLLPPSTIVPKIPLSHPATELPPKQRIRRAFDQAAISYDDAADVQREICDRLKQYFEQVNPALEPETILDAGSGTGYGASLLTRRWSCAHLTLVDFAPAMLSIAHTHKKHDSAKVSLICADIEALPIIDQHFDLYWSSLAWQWNDPEKCLTEAGRVLKPGGILAVATLGTQNFPELRHAFADIDDYSHVLSIASPEQLLMNCQKDGWIIHLWQRQTVRRFYSDVRNLLRSVKAVGAREVKTRRPVPFSRAAWRTINARYEELREKPGLPLSYDVLWLIATCP